MLFRVSWWACRGSRPEGYGPVPALGVDSRVIWLCACCPTCRAERGTGRCAPVLKGACGTRLGSDEALLPFPDLPEATNNQQETFMMSSPVAGIDPHQSNFTVAVVDANGVEITHASFANGGVGYLEAIELLSSHGVGQVGVEGSASWGSHVAIALVAAGFDAREVPAATGRAAASSTASRQDRHRRRGADGTGPVGRAIARSGAGARGL